MLLTAARRMLPIASNCCKLDLATIVWGPFSLVRTGSEEAQCCCCVRITATAGRQPSMWQLRGSCWLALSQQWAKACWCSVACAFALPPLAVGGSARQLSGSCYLEEARGQQLSGTTQQRRGGVHVHMYRLWRCQQQHLDSIFPRRVRERVREGLQLGCNAHQHRDLFS